MKKMMNLVAALVCATILVGCGDKKSSEGASSEKEASSQTTSPQAKHEEIVKGLCSVVQSGKTREEADKFWNENVDSSFQELVKRRKEKENSKAYKKALGAMAKSKESVKTKVVKTFEEKGVVMASAIEATCADATLYFVVGKAGKDKPDKILYITSNKEEALSGGR